MLWYSSACAPAQKSQLGRRCFDNGEIVCQSNHPVLASLFMLITVKSRTKLSLVTFNTYDSFMNVRVILVGFTHHPAEKLGSGLEQWEPHNNLWTSPLFRQRPRSWVAMGNLLSTSELYADTGCDMHTYAFAIAITRVSEKKRSSPFQPRL